MITTLELVPKFVCWERPDTFAKVVMCIARNLTVESEAAFRLVASLKSGAPVTVRARVKAEFCPGHFEKLGILVIFAEPRDDLLGSLTTGIHSALRMGNWSLAVNIMATVGDVLLLSEVPEQS